MSAVLLLATATIVVLPVFRSMRLANAVAAASIVGVPTLLLVTIITRWWREGQGPFLTIYDVLLSNLFSLGLIFGFVYFRTPVVRKARILVLPFLLMLGVWLLTASASTAPLPATFESYWLWLHVLSGKIFLGFAMIGTAVSTLLLFGTRARSDAHTLQVREELDRTLWQLMAIAFVAHSCMLVTGAVWAYSAWGRYWAWDPLETWSLITWLSLGITLHARVTFSRVPSAWLRLMVIGVFTLAFLTFFGVPFLSPAPHKGVM